MNKQESLNYLKEVLHEIENMSQEEFEKRCVEPRIDEQGIVSFEKSDFVLLDPRTMKAFK